jgi:hypothetical protein
MAESVGSQNMSSAHQEAMAMARDAPGQLVPRHVSSHDVRALIIGGGSIGRFNNWLAVLVTRGVGSMWAAYIFVLIALVSFPQALQAFLNGDALIGITWLSQSFLQLVLLPILLVGQRVISVSQDARAETDHETLTALHTINVQQLQILEMLAKVNEARGG